MQNFGAKTKSFIKANSKSIVLGIVIVLMNLFTIFVSLQKNDYSFVSKRAFAAYAITALVTTLVIFVLYKAKLNLGK